MLGGTQERWCVTYRDFSDFVQDVRRLWRQGQLGGDEDPSLADPDHGPNLYLVNEQYVKPVTLKAGGMSYAPQHIGWECFPFHQGWWM